MSLPRISIDREEHGSDITGDIFGGWAGPWFLRRRRWCREYFSLHYRYGWWAKIRLHKGPRST